MESAGADITVGNSIVYFNGGTPLSITSAVAATPVTYSDIQNGCTGTGNINANPQFASTTTPDYHLMSMVGRYDPQAARWVTDSVQSPCVDAGDPKSALGAEPAPNGDRINMGAYGGTRQASKGGVVHSIYYVDVRNGRDTNNGLSQTRAFATLQKAMDAAQSGDTVLVWPGTYQEEVTFESKAVTVLSAGDAPVVTAPNGYAFSFYGAESNKSILANFVITGCGSGGIFCDSGASPTLRNLTITANQVGIVAYGGADPNIANCIIWQNTSGQLSAWKANFNWYLSYSCVGPDSPSKTSGNINANPLFGDPAHGDYHLRSPWGRYVLATGTWTSDSMTSPCLDAGDPAESVRADACPTAVGSTWAARAVPRTPV